LHASQPPLHAELQQVPSTQLPDWHSPGALQAWPSASLPTHTRAPASVTAQRVPGLQSESALHDSLQPSVPLQSVRPHSFWGSVPAAMGAQVPRCPATLHASHAPVQSVAQHTPSTQRPPRHSASTPQDTPLAFCPTHAPLMQAAFALQSEGPLHGSAQADAPLQTALPHSSPGSVPLACAVQVPRLPERLHASHVPLHALLQHTPSTHCPEAHCPEPAQDVPFAFFVRQVPASQKLPVLHSVSEVHGLMHAAVPAQYVVPHSPAESVPRASGEQVPTLPARLHASHVPLQAVPQQTPSAHWPDTHSLPPAHALPVAFCAVQLPDRQ
jgi:hypothetical protein